MAAAILAFGERAAARQAPGHTAATPVEPVPAAAPATAARSSARDVSAPNRPLRLFFITDVHSRHHLLDRFIEQANRERPDLIIEGGDFVHDGTASEFRRAYVDRARLEPAWHVAKGNHDAERRGPFAARPPSIPEFQAFDHGGVRFILLDNHRGVLTEAQFRRLESELEANDGRRTVVAMHIPPFLGRVPLLIRLRHLVPFRLARPTMRDRQQIEHFRMLMARHRVLAVLTGHSHFHDEQTRDGVRYIVAGTAGGLRPGPRITNEYVDITIDDRELDVRRVALNEPASDPVSFVAHVFRFFADINGFSHAEQGWNFVPTTGVQLRSGLTWIERRGGGGGSAALFGAAYFERVLGGRGRQAFFAEPLLSAGPRDLAGNMVAGYKIRPLGDFNENVYIGGAATANAGMLRGSASAGLGVQLGLGFEMRGLTAELSRNWATNHRATSFAVGHRF